MLPRKALRTRKKNDFTIFGGFVNSGRPSFAWENQRMYPELRNAPHFRKVGRGVGHSCWFGFVWVGGRELKGGWTRRCCNILGLESGLQDKISFEPGFGAYQSLAQKIKAPFSRIFSFFSFEGLRAISKPAANPGVHQTQSAPKERRRRRAEKRSSKRAFLESPFLLWSP